MIRRRWTLIEQATVDGRVLGERGAYWTRWGAWRVAGYRNRVYGRTGVRRFWTPTRR